MPEIDFNDAWERAADFFGAADMAYNKTKADRATDEENRWRPQCPGCGENNVKVPGLCGTCSGNPPYGEE